VTLFASLSLSACTRGDRRDTTAAGNYPRTPGTLTVAAVTLPAPGFWPGRGPADAPSGGFEQGLRLRSPTGSG